MLLPYDKREPSCDIGHLAQLNEQMREVGTFLPTAFLLPLINSCSHFSCPALLAALSPSLKDDTAFSFILCHSLSLVHQFGFSPPLDILLASTFLCIQGLEFLRKPNPLNPKHLLKVAIGDLHY